MATESERRSGSAFMKATVAFGPLELAPIGPSPLVSVLMTNHNYSHYLPAAIESVVTQTYEKLEMVICDDGSTDDSLAVARRYSAQDDRVKVIAKPNGGSASGLNAAYRSCSGAIVAMLDSDDVFMPAKVERLVHAWQVDPAPGLIYHRSILVDGSLNRLGLEPSARELRRGWMGNWLQRRGGSWIDRPATSSLAMHSDLAKVAFPIPEGLSDAQDVFVTMLCALVARVESLDEPLTLRRIHTSNVYGTLGPWPKRGHDEDARVRIAAINEVNRRVLLLGANPRLLDPDQNLHILEKRFLAAALTADSSRSALFRHLATTTRVAWSQPGDFLHKVYLPVASALAIACPPRARRRLLAATHGNARWKATIRRLLGQKWRAPR